MNYVDYTEESPAILSICTGLRGLERGIERVIGPIRAVAYVEIEAFIITNLVAQMESGLLAPTPIWSDVKTLPAKEFHRKVHIITGGYPCQPFSTAGLRLGESDPRHLWPFIKQAIGAIGPICCFFENVSGHLTLGYETVKRDLEAMDYTVKEGIYSAEEVGAPHRRERLFILALANTDNHGYGTGSRGISKTSRSAEGQAQGTYREWLRAIIRNSGKNVPYSLCDHGEEIQTKKRHPSVGQEPLCNGYKRRIEAFPAGYGDAQFYWEAARTIEPGLGCSINGYNFREDLLRGLGNGVVEQTAELAFRDLLRKHGI